MTNKEQVIIDGVDISRCVYRDSENRCCCDSSKKNEGEERLTGRGGCAYNPNCYFKQLARKTQELELLKRTNKIHVDTLEQLSNKYNDLKDDYRELQQRHNGAFQDFEKLKQECEELKNKIKKLRKNIALEIGTSDRYRKALEEIERVVIPLANKNLVENCWSLLDICKNCKSKKECGNQSPYTKFKHILDIISEAKDINVPHKKDGE